jgi:hypothetical protein
MGTIFLWVNVGLESRAFGRLIVFTWYRWLAWTCDAIDFFSVSLSVPSLEAEFGKAAHDITTGITLTLLIRSVGAVSIVIQILSQGLDAQCPTGHLRCCC